MSTNKNFIFKVKNLEIFKPKVINKEIDKEYKLKSLILIGSIFIACAVITNVIGIKIMTFLGFNFTAGVITYAAVFLTTDIISEKWGKRTAYFFVYLGFIANMFLLLFVKIAIISPPANFWVQNQEAYLNTLGGVTRLVIASMIAYLISQLHDVWAFDFWRRQTKGKWLPLRNNLSTMASQLIDTIIFITVAFYGRFTLVQIFTMIVGQIIIKWILAILDTPFIWFVSKLLGEPVRGAHPKYN